MWTLCENESSEILHLEVIASDEILHILSLQAFNNSAWSLIPGLAVSTGKTNWSETWKRYVLFTSSFHLVYFFKKKYIVITFQVLLKSHRNDSLLPDPTESTSFSSPSFTSKNSIVQLSVFKMFICCALTSHPVSDLPLDASRETSFDFETILLIDHLLFQCLSDSWFALLSEVSLSLLLLSMNIHS